MPPSTDAVQALLDGFVARGEAPGLQYAAVDASGLIQSACAGLADLQDRRRMSETSILLMYSMSKTVTAATVVKLASAGSLDLDEPVRPVLPWLPYDEPMTARQLLTHTAGLVNPLPLRWVHAGASHPSFDAQAALRRAVCAHPRLKAAPGTRFAYSNLGYWLLGALLEGVTGQPFEQCVHEQVLAPLGIAAPSLGYTVQDESQRACAYLERYSLLGLMAPWLIDRALLGASKGRWRMIRPHYPDGAAFGGLVGSATGLAPFLQDQLSQTPRLWPRATLDMFLAPQQLARGPIPMTLGWHLDEHPRLGRMLFKEGGGGGFHSLMRLYPAAGLGSVVLSNATASPVSRWLDQLDMHLAQAPDRAPKP